MCYFTAQMALAGASIEIDRKTTYLFSWDIFQCPLAFKGKVGIAFVALSREKVFKIRHKADGNGN